MVLRPNRHSAFTLVELLVVVAILSVLMAMLFPSLGKAKYQAKVVQCKARLHAVGLAMIVYAQENAGVYPMAADPNLTELGLDDWVKTVWRRSWEWQSGRGYDLRPTYREYLGGELDKTAKCPLASPYFADNDLDNLYLSNYMLYVTNNANQKFFKFALDDLRIVSSRVDRPWSPRSAPDLKFTYIASDAAFGHLAWQNDGVISGHPSPEGNYGQGGGPINSHPGHRLGTLADAPLTAPVNFVDGDGSVHEFYLTAESVFDTDQWVSNNYRSNKYMMPLGLAR